MLLFGITLQSHDDGTFTYTPNPGFVGTDSFSYTADDDVMASNTATVTINVTNQAPVASNDSYSLLHDQSLSENAVGGLLANDSDADGDVLKANIASDVSNGLLVFQNDGSFTYIPKAGFVGTDSFTYTAGDGIVSSLKATVTLSVQNSVPDDPPVFDPTTYTDYVPQNIGNGSVFQTVTASDANGDALTYSITAGNDSGVFAINPSSGGISVTDDSKLNYQTTPTYTLTVEVSNSEEEEAATPAEVNVNVQPDDEIIAQPDGGPKDFFHYTATLGNDLIIPLTEGVLANDYSIQGKKIYVQNPDKIIPPAQGTLTMRADGGFTYKPTQAGVYTFKYKATDGMATSGATTVTITVNPADTALKGEPDTYYMEKDQQTLEVSNPDYGVLANDAEPGVWQDLQAQVVQQPKYGKLQGSALGSMGTFTYIPNKGWQGYDSFTYQIQYQGQTSQPILVEIMRNGNVLGNPKRVNNKGTGGVALVGGGTVPDKTLEFLINHANHGDFVILTYSSWTAVGLNDKAGGERLGKTILENRIWALAGGNFDGKPNAAPGRGTVAGFDSVETIAIRNEEDATNQNYINDISNAAAIFITGGDQSDYYKLWRPKIQAAVNAALNNGAATGGTSAGMASLGGVAYMALESSAYSSNLFSQYALEFPNTQRIQGSLKNDFLQTIKPPLTNIVTETHFQPGDNDPQGRMGRLITFLANMYDGHPAVIKNPRGIAASNSTAVDIEPTGIATIVAVPGLAAPVAYFVEYALNTDPQVDNHKPLTWTGISVIRVAAGGTFNLNPGQWVATGGVSRKYTIDAINGLLAEKGNDKNDYY